MTKVLTITVPIYNTEKYLRRCLDTLVSIKQINDIEIILVSDGSKDNSIAIMHEYKTLFPNSVVIIDKENGGHGSTINSGLEIATGKYFRVIDSDDWVNIENFEKLVTILKKEDTDLIITNYRKEHIYNGVSEYMEYKKLKEELVYTFNKMNLEDFNGEYIVMATANYKTELLRKSGLKLFEKTFYVDMQYNYFPITKLKTFKFYNLDIYRYFIGRKDQSVNTSSFVRNYKHHEKVLKFLLEEFEKNKSRFSKNQYRYIEKMIYYMTYTHYCIFMIYEKDKKKGFKEIVDFDNYLKNTSTIIYDKSNDMRKIKYLRKTNFITVKFKLEFIEKIIGKVV